MTESKVHFHTNLDEAQGHVRKLTEAWRGPVPRQGERIAFAFERADLERPVRMFRGAFELEVVGVRYEGSAPAAMFNRPKLDATDGTRVHVELHMPSSWNHRSIADWIAYYRRHVEGREP